MAIEVTKGSLERTVAQSHQEGQQHSERGAKRMAQGL